MLKLDNHKIRNILNSEPVYAITDSDALCQIIVEAVQDKKARNVVQLNLTQVDDAMADHFIICHGDSTPQVRGIVDEVMKKVKEKTGDVVHQPEGYQELDWVLLDYFNVVVHVFLKGVRDIYQLEELWSDAEIHEYEFID